ncbi:MULTISPECIES: ABC transporter permease [Rahnella]|jgi:glutathione transport system permease protein|uniref:ABC transporter permease n=1 Tax=Rahnella sp. (strain Y9602) TaxID=2703885 RepID=A0A0H3FAJ8_RAHSY|nr:MULTISPECIES: ABC transporter permease [Rahnella]AYA07221.1 ABC transporter permease [Rahnella aquatilis]ADW73924.1 binding-protein-dependent transport systems inner membrane component [Rahnella aceris]AZP42411.1 ABC transporter permease [Rahnella aquatilis]AZP46751.1 ABC transporter permease [Rahnella aquatilis]AZP51154.1 ABC transporter permease [Rahnella aquatilis]
MLRYILQRLGQSVLVMFGVSLLIFYSLHLTGDPAAVMMPPGSSQQEIDNFRHSMGFDRSLTWQYWHYLTGVLQGDLGESLRYSQPVTELIGQRVPATLLLAITALLWSTVAGLLLGIVSALYQNTLWDLVSRLLAFSGQAVPVFWLGLLLIIAFSLNLRWLPSGGYGSASQLVMPAISLGAYYMSAIARLIRASLIDVLQQDYIRTARAKGLSRWRIVVRHGLRNALIPVITVQGMYFASLLGGALVTEIIFAWPGIGRLAVQAIQNRDFPLVQAIVLLAALVFVGINLIIDLLYVVLNPRIRL